jgi:hypothetical protein
MKPQQGIKIIEKQVNGKLTGWDIPELDIKIRKVLYVSKDNWVFSCAPLGITYREVCSITKTKNVVRIITKIATILNETGNKMLDYSKQVNSIKIK